MWVSVRAKVSVCDGVKVRVGVKMCEKGCDGGRVFGKGVMQGLG